MQKADTIFAVMQERGKKGQPVEQLYRMLFNPDLYLRAYAKLYPNEGAMTPGATPETVDGMSMKKIDNIIEAIRFERYQWTPVRRTYVKKANGKLRPLGLPTWSDKLLQEVIRFILEAYYEPQFSQHSHGFRPKKGCHTALREIQHTWTGIKWIVEGDISQYFDTIDHSILLEILREKIKDNRFIRLIQNLLEAGYIEKWEYNKTYSGTPQGGVLSPLLANIYLDKLDKYAEEIIATYNKGEGRTANPEYERLIKMKFQAVKKGEKDLAKSLIKQARTMPSLNTTDPNYRRVKYVRYADDFMLGVIGPKSDAQEIKQKIRVFLQDKLKLKLSEEKTLITSASQETAKFLGYEIKTEYCNTKITKNIDGISRRSINSGIVLLLPKSVIEKKSKPYLRNGKPIHIPHLMINADYSIVQEYQMKLKGLYQYYAMAGNVSDLYNLKWMMEQSLVKTLAGKHKTSARAIYAKHATKVPTEKGKSLKCIQVTVERDDKKPLIARFGGFSLERKQTSKINDQMTPETMNGFKTHTEILQRLLADKCEICGSSDMVEVHHVKSLKDVTGSKNERTDWKRYMASRQRKTLVVCQKCHYLIGAGKPLPALGN
ncbi:MAG: reverse transcriptase domain-containing protein [Chloroflexi bacterium]|nr:reverse transcriptase domain-containing protein [Chloroflexota bacterium]